MFLRYKFLSLNTYNLHTLYLREQRTEDSWLFYEDQKGSASKIVW